uniref:Chloroplast outer envelope 24 kD protein n=1 Tax=Zea mays TaxID=4577 RepID=B6TM56_MAIZE|nr:chloroplast outer envelope 24 kD protein [Zea mays]
MGNAGSAPDQPKNSADGAGAADAESRRGPPSTVRFFPDGERHKARQPPPIKLEEEEGVPPPPATEEEMAPRNLWQVYALGAFIVLRWAWAKRKENQDRKDSPDAGDGNAPDRST